MRRRCGERRDRADQKAAEAHRSFFRNGGFPDETVGYHTEGVRRRGGSHERSFLEASAVLRACGGGPGGGGGRVPPAPGGLPLPRRRPPGAAGRAGARRKNRG